MTIRLFQRRQATILLAVTIFVFSALAPSLMVSPVLAAENNDAWSVTKQRARTNLHGLIRCLDEDLEGDERDVDGDTWTTDRANSFDLWNDDEFAVGFDLDSGNGDRTCKEMASRLFRYQNNNAGDRLAIGVSKNRFLKILLEPANGPNTEDNRWKEKEGGKARLKTILNNAKERLKHNDGRSIGPNERVRRAVVGARQCIEVRPRDGLVNPDQATVTIRGEQYIYKEGKSPGDNIPVGYDFVSGGGNMKCSDLLGLVNRSNGFERFPEAGGGGGGGGGPGGAGEEQTCGSSADFSLSWIMCPVIEGAQATSEKFYSDILEPLLSKVPINVNNSDAPGYASYTAWQSFRVLANLILVGAMLLLVYGMVRNGGGR